MYPRFALIWIKSYCNYIHLAICLIVILQYNFSGDLVEDIEEGHSFCVENIKDFTSCFLFSIETQHTIGWEQGY